jgi:predicted GH43/DUF377 family glycosyl hydrolase
MKQSKLMILARLFLFICLLATTFAYSNSIFEQNEMRDGIALETKQIKIPGHPHAFNPSIVLWKNSLILSFREIYDPFVLSDFDSAGNSWIGIVMLDENFNPISEPQVLDLQGLSSIPSRAEDPRLITVGDRLYLIYSDNKDEFISKRGFRMQVAEVFFDGNNFSVGEIVSLLDFEGAHLNRREKNWVPFEFGGELQLAYSLVPHKVFSPSLLTGKCKTTALTKSEIAWNWGELRGGTPGLLIDDDNYLAFFHSSKKVSSPYSNGKKTLHYFIGAYTFSAQSPFEIKQMSPDPIIIKEFYADNIYVPYWKPLNVAFPGGLIANDKHIWMAFGRHDHEMWIVKFDRKNLLETLKPVSNKF